MHLFKGKCVVRRFQGGWVGGLGWFVSLSLRMSLARASTARGETEKKGAFTK
jgi:hypothetical protein